MSRISRKRSEEFIRRMKRQQEISEYIDSWIVYLFIGCFIGLISFWYL